MGFVPEAPARHMKSFPKSTLEGAPLGGGDNHNALSPPRPTYPQPSARNRKSIGRMATEVRTMNNTHFYTFSQTSEF